MGNQNLIISGRDNPVVISITGLTDQDGNSIDLTAFTTIYAKFKGDERNTSDDPTSIIVSADELRLHFGDTDQTGASHWQIWGVNGDYPDGLELTSCCLDNLGKTEVC